MTALVLDRMYRMPTVFGPTPGPRNLPHERQHLRFEKETFAIAVTARTDPASLAQLLPARCELDGEARLEIGIYHLTKVGWLAGRGYNIAMVRIPAVFAGERETVRGSFIPVLWESLCEPILTGREELGWPKLPAEIPDATLDDGSWRAAASWQGFRFLDIEASGFVESVAPEASAPMFVHKYIPRCGEWGHADASYIAVSGAERPATVREFKRGSGRFGFHPARWEDMPTQYPIVNGLAALPLEFVGATLTRTSGGGDLSSQRIVC
jgi:acetoacetate decarboxylase